MTADKKRHRANKNLVHSLLGSACAWCGNTDHRCLQIDHINAQAKPVRGHGKKQYRGASSVAKMIRDGVDVRKILRLLCANCHAIKTYEAKDYLNAPRQTTKIATRETTGRLALANEGC